MGTPAYTPLAHYTVGTAQASVTFSNISQAYRDLVLVYTVTGSTTSETLWRLNNDTSTPISFVYMIGDGSTTSSTSQTNNGLTTGGPLSTSVISNHTINVMDYSTTNKHKSALSRHNLSSGSTWAVAHRWASNAAVNSIYLYPASGNFATGSTFSLYGVIA